MMVAAGGDESRVGAVSLGELKAEHAAVEAERTLKVGDLEMHMADANFRVHWARVHKAKHLRLRREAELLHKVEVVPEQELLIHHAALPMPHRAHCELELLPGGLDGLAIGRGHAPGEPPLYDPDDACPVALRNLDRMSLDPCVWRKDEHRLQLLDVRIEALGRMPVRIMHEDILRGLSLSRSHF